MGENIIGAPPTTTAAIRSRTRRIGTDFTAETPDPAAPAELQNKTTRIGAVECQKRDVACRTGRRRARCKPLHLPSCFSKGASTPQISAQRAVQQVRTEPPKDLRYCLAVPCF